ncbi:MAG: hypothetical protein Q6364_08855 [Candidatus Hermodarchaeota archaeon]|nr:hypothetical protein [Candidatus Hermodarchaeota archaeon]
MYSKRVPIWVHGALITILVWLVVLYIILTYFTLAPEHQPLLVLVTAVILLICFGLVCYYWTQYGVIFGTQYKPDI